MGLPEYFSKDLLAINRIIKSDTSFLTNKLNDIEINILIDENGWNSYEGECGIELMIRLLSRLYPTINIIDLSKNARIKVNKLKSLIRKINSNIALSSKFSEKGITIVAGDTTKIIPKSKITLYYGSNNWIAKFSQQHSQSFGASQNPLGSSISACITASNIFRFIFKEQLSFFKLDDEFSFSIYNLSSTILLPNPKINEVTFDELKIIGLGAIGNGLIWLISKLSNLSGTISLIDNESISLSNLQRYILTVEKDENHSKVNLAKKILQNKKVNVEAFEGTWSEYLESTQNWEIKNVAVCIDNEKDRIGIQSTLPKTIFNAFTEPESIGITRHKDFINSACLACSHIPNKKKKDFINEIADNCNIPAHHNLVKIYYNSNLAVDQKIQIVPNAFITNSLLEEIAQANKIPIENLKQYKGKKIEEFYSNFICGGVILQVSNIKNEVQDVDAPLAFQSAMAGIILASELVKFYNNPKNTQMQRTDIYHLAPISPNNPYHRPIEKDTTMRCICQDGDFKSRYKAKWKK